MERLVDEVGGSIGLTAEEYYDKAHDVYEFLGAPGGNIDTIGGDPDVQSATEEELAGWNGDGLTTSYGIDASTTQERDFTNGLTVCLANAKAGVIGDGDHSLADESHIVAAVFDENGETGLESERMVDNEFVTADIEVLTSDDPREVQRMGMKRIARLYSEGRHLNTVVDNGAGVVFVDGPIYPPLVLNEVMARQYAGRDDAWTDVLGDLVMNYVTAIDAGLNEGWPIVGVVKTMDTSGLVNDLETKMEWVGIDAEIPWAKDIHFLTDLLQTEDPGEFVYTSWFEEQRRYSRVRNEDDEEYVEPFAGVPGDRDPEAYHRAFFFVNNPRTNTIMRVETAKAFVTDAESRELIQQRALAELAKMGNAPEAVLQADNSARISRQNQHELFSRLYGRMRSVTDYNEDYRGPDYLGDDE